MKPRLAYFVPEFPTQTHSFFWSEYLSLREENLEILLCSTKRPDISLCPQPWSLEAHKLCLYGFPPQSYGKDLLFSLPKISFRGLAKLIKGIVISRDLTLKEKFKNAALAGVAILFGGRLLRENIKHIHSHFQYSGADLVYFIYLLYRIPYSISRHGDNCGVGNQVAKWENACFGITVTERLKKDLLLEQPRLKTPILVAPMGVDADFFKRNSSYVPYKPGDASLQLFCCSRINSAKGYKELLHCLSQLVEDDLNVRLRIAGQDERGGTGYMQDLKKLAKELKLADRVSFLGSLTQKRVKEELERSHIFILPTKQEAIGVAYMEAMAMELPVIGSRVGGVPELVMDRITGLLVEPGDIDGLVKAVHSIIKDNLRAKLMGATGRKRVVQFFKPNQSVTALMSGLNQHTNFFEPAANNF